MIGIEDGEAAGPFGQGGKNLLVGGSGFWKLRHDGTRLVHGIVETVDRIASAIADSRGAGAAAAGCAACSGSSRSTLTTGACSASPACSPATASSASCATGSTCPAAAYASTRSASTRSACAAPGPLRIRHRGQNESSAELLFVGVLARRRNCLQVVCGWRAICAHGRSLQAANVQGVNSDVGFVTRVNGGS